MSAKIAYSLVGARVALAASLLGASLFMTARAPGDAPKTAPSAAPSPSPLTLTKTAGKPRQLVTDDTSVYWADGKKILGVDKTGGAVRTVANTAMGASHLVIAAGKTYWTEGEAVFTLGKAPATTKLKDFHIATSGGSSEPFDIDGLHASTTGSLCVTAYYGTGQVPQVTCFDVAKPATETTFDLTMEMGAPMTMDEKNVYWAGYDETDGDAVFMASYTPAAKKLGKRTKLVSKSDAVTGFMVDGGTLFWFEKTGLVSVSTSASTPARTVLAAGATGSAIAVDASHAYYLSGGKVTRVARTAGAKAQVVAGTKVDCFTIDTSSVYWVENGSLQKTSK